MASQTLSSVADTWAAGTTVGAYVRPASTAWDRASTPPTAAVTTAAVSSTGTLAFTGLADDTAYVAYASGRSRNFSTPPVSAGSGSLTPKGYQQLTAGTGAAVALTVPSGATKAYMVASLPVRWRDDGVDPTASVGTPITTGGDLAYDGSLAAFKVIGNGASSTLDIAYYA